MKVLPASNNGIKQAIDLLRRGGVVAHATETCYGLACDLSNPEAVAKLFAIKQRPDTMPVSALFESIEQAKQYLEWNNLAEQLAHDHLPGPLTIILSERTDAPHPLCVTPNFKFQISNFKFRTVGARLSPHPTAQTLVEQFGSPLSTTSANIHGKPNPYSAEDLLEQFSDAETQPDIILDDGPLKHNDASTVIDLSSGEIHVLRKGNLAIE